jgi:FixJ family two-component response regulator
METTPFVAVIDDDHESRMLLADILESAGIASVCFEFTDYFLDYTDVYKPACIILDMSGPGLGGAEVECQLSEVGSAAPVLVVTGDADGPTATAALSNGALAVCSKPIDRLEVISQIRRILISGRADQEAWRAAA